MIVMLVMCCMMCDRAGGSWQLAVGSCQLAGCSVTLCSSLCLPSRSVHADQPRGVLHLSAQRAGLASQAGQASQARQATRPRPTYARSVFQFRSQSVSHTQHTHTETKSGGRRERDHHSRWTARHALYATREPASERTGGNHKDARRCWQTVKKAKRAEGEITRRPRRRGRQ